MGPHPAPIAWARRAPLVAAVFFSTGDGDGSFFFSRGDFYLVFFFFLSVYMCRRTRSTHVFQFVSSKYVATPQRPRTTPIHARICNRNLSRDPPTGTTQSRWLLFYPHFTSARLPCPNPPPYTVRPPAAAHRVRRHRGHGGGVRPRGAPRAGQAVA